MTGLVSEVSQEQIIAEENIDLQKDLCLEELALIIQTTRLKKIEAQLQAKINEVKKRQATVKELHEILSRINSSCDSKGKFDIKKNPELKKMIQRAKDLGIDIKSGKVTWNSDEKDRLVENVRMKCEDHNSANQMDLQDSQMMMNRRFEIYELTKSIMKPLHDDKINKARKIG